MRLKREEKPLRGLPSMTPAVIEKGPQEELTHDIFYAKISSIPLHRIYVANLCLIHFFLSFVFLDEFYFPLLVFSLFS